MSGIVDGIGFTNEKESLIFYFYLLWKTQKCTLSIIFRCTNIFCLYKVTSDPFRPTSLLVWIVMTLCTERRVAHSRGWKRLRVCPRLISLLWLDDRILYKWGDFHICTHLPDNCSLFTIYEGSKCCDDILILFSECGDWACSCGSASQCWHSPPSAQLRPHRG